MFVWPLACPSIICLPYNFRKAARAGIFLPRSQNFQTGFFPSQESYLFLRIRLMSSENARVILRGGRCEEMVRFLILLGGSTFQERFSMNIICESAKTSPSTFPSFNPPSLEAFLRRSNGWHWITSWKAKNRTAFAKMQRNTFLSLSPRYFFVFNCIFELC